MKIALVAFVALVSQAVAAPVTSSGSCSLQCTSSHSFAYETGKSYVYDYSVETSTALIGVSDDDAKLRITARANIDVTSPCEFVLRVADVNLEGSAHAGEFSEALTKYPLRFSFQDGLVENVCSDVSEPKWVLNIKRGLLSTFQNTMTYHGDETLQEKDISGVCNTHYTAVNEGDVINVEKVTDITSCSQRPDFSNFIISSSYNTESPVQNLPLLQTTNECHQKIKDDILISVDCQEIYKSNPFKSERGVAMTTVKTTLVLKSQAEIQPLPNNEFFRQSLVFDNENMETPEANIEKVENILRDLIVDSSDDIHPEAPAHFSALIEALKNLDYSQLKQVYDSYADSNAHKFLADAMPLVGTSASTKQLTDMIRNNEINDIEKDIWFTSLAFYKNPTIEMLDAIAPLLQDTSSQKALLGTSALINNYCKTHKTCERETTIKMMIQVYENQLGAGCRSGNQDEKTKVLVALKALGNVGHWVNAKTILETCYSEQNDMEVRVAAIDAWRHTPCEYDHSNLLTLFQDESYDSELRIAAYLSLMSCPTPSLINMVKERLISEGVNQVGSFIWTHMTNLQESASPEKQWLHELIGEELLQKKFNTEALRFSRNYESSYFMNELNLGASVESNVIFNSKSYLPSSAMLNLTLDLFGESINFFEIGGRIEGFESYIERFFGTNGYFPEEHIQQVLRNMRSKSNAESTSLEGFLDKITDEPEGSYYMRVFGNELHYHHFKGLENFITSSDASNPMETLMNLFRMGNVDYTKSFQLIDTHLYIPTISGLPIVLDSKITGTFGLKANGNIMAKSLTNMNIEGRFHPSAALEVDGLMVVDAHVAKTGVKISSTLHTSTFLDGKIEITEGKVVDIAINSPKDKVELLDVKGEFFYLIDDQEVKKEAATKREYQGCSRDILGMAICGQYMYTPGTETIPIFAMAGPFKSDMYLKKTGTQTGYVLQFKKENNKMEFLIDTPGSQEDHKVSLAIIKGDHTIEVDIHTPIKSAKAKGEYTLSNLKKMLKVSLTMDSGELYAFETGLLKTIDDTTIFEPSLTLTIPEGDILNMHGTIKTKLDYYDTKVSTNVDVDYKWGSQQKVLFKFDLQKTLTDSKSTYSLHGSLDPTQFSDFKTSVDMSFSETEHQHYIANVQANIKGESYVFEGKLDDNSVRGKFNVNADGTLSAKNLDVKANIGIYAESDKASVQVESNVNGQTYNLKIDGTKSSVVIEANIIRHILLNAYISSDEGRQKMHITGEWNKDVDPSASFMIEGQIDKTEAKIQFKFAEREALVSAKLLDKGIEFEGIWGSQKVSALIQYTLGDTKSLSVLVLTPFQGLEKQEAKFSATLKDNEINSLLRVNWQNSKQVSLNVIGKLQPGMSANTLRTEIVLSTTLPKLERMSFKLDHEMNGATINMDMLATYNTLEVKTTFHNIPTSNGVKTSLVFESPFSEKMQLTLDHALSNNDLTSILEAKYGGSVATASLKGHILLVESQNVILNLKINTPSVSIPEINANINYKCDSSQLSLIFEGVMGEKKVMLNVNGELTRGETTKMTGDLRLITPFLYPITATVSHTLDSKSLESSFEVTRFWSNYGNLKAHAKGHLVSSNDILFVADFSTPATKASVSLKHRVTGTAMVSSLDVQLNRDRINLVVNGVLDISNHLANLEAEITSTLSGLDELKVTIESLKSGSERISKLILSRNDKSVTIDHVIAFTDNTNWENTFNINGIYKLKNTQTHVGTVYTHDMEYLWNSENIHLTLNLDNKSTESSHDIEARITVITPWTQVMKIELNHTDNGTEYKPQLIIEYIPGKKIDLSTTIIFGDIFSCESILSTPFTDSLAYKLTLDFSPRKAASLLLKWGAKKVMLDIAGKLDSGKLDGSVEIRSTYLSTPIRAHASYDIISQQKKVHLDITYIKKLEITGLYSGNLNGGEWSLVAELPIEEVKNVELDGKWIYDVTSAEVEVHSSVSSFESTAFSAKYDFKSKKQVDLILTHGSNIIHILGKMENEKVLIDMSTPFSGWEKLKLSFFVSETTIDAFVAKNDQTLSVKGTMHLRQEKGTIHLSITTPFANYEAISVDLSYSLRGPLKKIQVKSSFAKAEFSLVGFIDLSKDLNPNMKLDMITPFKVISKIGAEAHWDLSNVLKVAEVKAYRNDRQYHWQLEVYSDSYSAAHIKSQIFTPISDWQNVRVEGDFDIINKPYTFKLLLDKAGAVTTVEGTLNIEQNAINGQLITPIPGWETLNINGNFNLDEKKFTGKFEVTKSADKYQLTTDILLNTQTPKLHITLVTPLSYAAKIDFVFDSNLIETEKHLLVTLIVNTDIYSLELTGQKIYKTGYIKFLAKSPIPSFTSIDINAKYDFSQDLKSVELDFKIEDDSKHFYLKTDVQNNKFLIELHTPFSGFEVVKMVGDYTAVHDKHTVLASFEKDYKSYDYNAEVTLTDYSMAIALSTPIDVVKNVAISVKYELFKNGLEGLLHFDKNGDIYDISTKGIFTPMKSDLLMSVRTPIKGWKKLTVEAKYDVLSEDKIASVFIQKGSFKKKVTIEGKYDIKSGYIKLELPIDHFEILGASYSLDLDFNSHNLQASLTLKKNSDEWKFLAQGEYSANMIVLKFKTPFQEFKSISVGGKIDYNQRLSYLNIELGSYKFNIHLSYASDDLLLKITTPFEVLKIASIGFTSKWTAEQKSAKVNIIYNNNNYVVNGILLLTPRRSEMTLKATTPFTGFNDINMMVKYNLDSREELILSNMKSDQYEYSFKLGAGIEETYASLIWDFTSTFQEWNHVQFIAKMNWAPEQKTLEVSLGKNENLKAIDVSGKLTGLSEGSLVIHTPFQGLEEMGGQYKLMTGEKLQGTLDLVLPFHLIPKINGEVNLDISEKIMGQIRLDIAGELYIIKSNLVGKSFEDGYNGDLEIYTPIHSLSKVILNGNISFKPWSSLLSHIIITLPAGTYEVDWKTEFSLGDSYFKVNLDTTIMSVNRKFIVEAKYPSLDNLEGTFEAVLNDQTHKIHGKFSSTSNHVEGIVDLESTLISGRRSIHFDLKFPNATYEQVILATTITTSTSHSLFIDLNVTNGIVANVKVDSPMLEKVSFTFKITPANAGVILETTSGTHGVQAFWRMTHKMPADYIGTLEIASPLLNNPYSLNVIFNGDITKMSFKMELLVGTTKHVIEGSSSISDSQGEFSLNIETPLFEINKATLSAFLEFASKVEINVTATYNDKSNNFAFLYDNVSKHFSVKVTSPFIPTGMVLGEGIITGEMMKDMLIKLTLKNNEKIIAGTMNVKLLSQDHMETDLVIITPFKGYKKMKFGATYVKDEDIKMVFFVDKPIRFNTELRLQYSEQEVMAFLKVETPIEDLKKVEGEFKIPLNIFAPKVSADVVIGGVHYAAHVNLRTKAPYELGIGYDLGEKYGGNFHLRTDSSFFSLLGQ